MFASNSAGAINPGRSKRGGVTVTSSTVDSRPPLLGPASRMASIRPAKPAQTCSAVVGDRASERFALGAAIGTPAALNQRQGYRMPRHAHGHGRAAGRHDVGDTLMSGQHQCQRPGPEVGRQGSHHVRKVDGDAVQLRNVGDVNDQRVGAGPALGREDARDGVGIEGVGSQAVNGLGGQGHQPSGADQGSRLGDRPRVGGVGVRGGIGVSAWSNPHHPQDQHSDWHGSCNSKIQIRLPSCSWGTPHGPL